jgi:dUTP pyrophosphatase
MPSPPIRDLRTDALTVELKVLDERIRAWGLPRYHSEMAAAVDLFACIDGPLEIAPQSTAQFVPAGIAIHIGDPNIAAIIVPRSGLGHKKGLVLGNLVGVLDADYTGPVMISVWNRSEAGSAPVVIEPGDRIAQLMFVPVVRPAFDVVDEFSQPSLRGAGGFGSTGQ